MQPVCCNGPEEKNLNVPYNNVLPWTQLLQLELKQPHMKPTEILIQGKHFPGKNGLGLEFRLEGVNLIKRMGMWVECVMPDGDISITCPSTPLAFGSAIDIVLY